MKVKDLLIMSEEEKNEEDMESLMTVEEKLKKANSPLLAKVLDVASNTLSNDVNRRTLVDLVFNIHLMLISVVS